MDLIKIKNLYSLENTKAASLLRKYEYPYEVLPHISEFILEYGKTLDALTINAIMSTAQIEVTSSKTQGQTVARQVIWETIEQFKALRYEVFQTPEVIPTGNDTNCCVCRVRRMVGANDTVG